MNKSRKSKKGKSRTGKSVQDLVQLLLNVDTARTIVGNKQLFKSEAGVELSAPEGVQPIDGPGPTKKVIAKRPAAKKPYDIDGEIPFVLKAKSSFDEDATFQDLVKNASKQTGVDAKLLFSSSLQEGMNQAALHQGNVSDAYDKAWSKNKSLGDDFPIDGFYNYGLDRFGEMAPELVKKGYLPKDFKYSVFDAQNEKKENIKTAAFRNNQDAIVAKAAVLKNEKDKVMAYAKKKGVTLTPETENYFVLASYNGGMGNAQKMMDEYQQQGGKGTDFITKDQTSRKGVSKNVLPRYNRMSKLKDFFEHGGEIKKLKQLTSFENPIAEGGITIPDPTKGDAEIMDNFNRSQLQQVQQEQGYTGPNPFQIGLTAASAILGREKTPRYYNRPEDSNYYNPKPQGTGSQAIMKYGGKMPDGGMVDPVKPIVPSLGKGQMRPGLITEDIIRPDAIKDQYSALMSPQQESLSKGDFYTDPKSGDIFPTQNYLSQKNQAKSQPTLTRFTHGGEVMNKGTLEFPIYKSGGYVEPISENINGNNILQFNGPSHEDGGIPISYMGNEVEVEGGETGFRRENGSFEVLGNLRNPLTGRLFKNDGKMIAKQENRYSKMLDKGMSMIEDNNPDDAFERLKFNTGKAKMMGAKDNLDKLALLKESIAEIQEQKLAVADDLGIKPLDIDKAKYGKMITAEKGWVIDPITGRKKASRQTTGKKEQPIVPPAPTGSTQMEKDLANEPVIKSAMPTEPARPQPKAPQFDLNYQPKKPIESDAEAFNYTNLIGEMYSIGTNRLEPVQMQKYNPELEQAYNVSFQDRINNNNSTFRAMQQQLGNNPAALATIAGQTAATNNSISANEFLTNQGVSADVYNKNRQTMNDAQLKNLGIQDQQYVRQEQARANTRHRTFDALSSISEKFLKHKAGQNELRVLENLYDYRFDKDYVAEHKGAAQNWRKPVVAGANPEKDVKPAEKAKKGKMGMNLTKEFKHYK